MIRIDETIEIGKLRKTHGTRGEIQCTLINDWLDATDPTYLILEIDNILVPFYLEEYRYKNDETVLFTFENIVSEEQASHLTGSRVFLHKTQLPQDADVTLQPISLIGYQVFDTAHGDLGTITDIDTSTINTLFALSSGIIFPAHDDFVVEINTEQKILRVDLPAGILNL